MRFEFSCYHCECRIYVRELNFHEIHLITCHNCKSINEVKIERTIKVVSVGKYTSFGFTK